MNFVDLLSESGKENWAKLYKDKKHKEWKPPVKDKRGIRCETKIEPIEEIDKLIRQKANPTERK